MAFYEMYYSKLMLLYVINAPLRSHKCWFHFYCYRYTFASLKIEPGNKQKQKL